MGLFEVAPTLKTFGCVSIVGLANECDEVFDLHTRKEHFMISATH